MPVAHETTVRAFEFETRLRRRPGPKVDVGPPAAAKGAEEIGLVRPLDAQGVVIGGGPRGVAARAGDILVDALVDDEAQTADGKLEEEISPWPWAGRSSGAMRPQSTRR